jgi:hypothetical protein
LGSFLNFGITWDGAEAVYNELIQHEAIAKENAELQALRHNLFDQARQILATLQK